IYDEVSPTTLPEISNTPPITKASIKLQTGDPIEITFENVSFSYPSRNKKLALEHASFRVKTGSTVAFVGGSGSGKSTCIQLLLRFYDPTDGHIKINGHHIQEYDINNLRQTIGLVSQEP
ncbi:unnamed protein product, partial [Adineta steineri]